MKEVRWAKRSSDVDVPLAGQLRGLVRDGVLALRSMVSRADPGPSLRAFYLHGVFDDEVPSFTRTLRRLQEIGRFVDVAAVDDVVSGRRVPEGRWFHLSFDDAHDNVYRNAFPILQELAIPATFFLPTRFVGATDDFLLQHWWKRSWRDTRIRTLRWEWVREMHAAGMTMGSHTRLHRRLSEISSRPAELDSEIAGSRRDIEDALGASCTIISWPYGTAADVDEAALDAVRAAGYTLCFSAVRGSTSAATSRWRIPRHGIHGGIRWSHMRYFAAGGGEPG